MGDWHPRVRVRFKTEWPFIEALQTIHDLAASRLANTVLDDEHAQHDLYEIERIARESMPSDCGTCGGSRRLLKTSDPDENETKPCPYCTATQTGSKGDLG